MTLNYFQFEHYLSTNNILKINDQILNLIVFLIRSMILFPKQTAKYILILINRLFKIYLILLQSFN